MATEEIKRLINVGEYHQMAEMGILRPGDRLELIQAIPAFLSPRRWENVLAISLVILNSANQIALFIVKGN